MRLRRGGGRFGGSSYGSFGKSYGRYNSNVGGGGDGLGAGGSGSFEGRGGGGTAGGGGDGSGNVFAAIWNAYNTNLDKYPILTKALTSLVGFFLGDLIAQKFLGEKGADLDKWRLARMASFGFLIHGPIGHYFYSNLDRLIVGKSATKVASKVFVDQICWAPIFTAIFFGYLGIAERKSPDQVVQKVRNDTWSGVKASWKV